MENLPIIDTQTASPTSTPVQVDDSAFLTQSVIATAQAHGGKPAQIDAPGGLVLREDAQVDTIILGSLPDRAIVTALGQSLDGYWVKVKDHDSELMGWIFHIFVNVPSGIENLPILETEIASNRTINIAA